MADDKAAKKEAKKQAKAEATAKRKEETKDLSIGWQYTIGVIVVIGGFICGVGIGWSSPAKSLLMENDITEYQFAWIASAFPLGAAFAQFLAVLAIKFIGLKYSIFIFEILTGCAWLPLIFCEKNFLVLLFARLGCGLSGGFCVMCPMYNGEMAHKTHRGTLGVFFQLFITMGILYSFVLGVFDNLLILNIACFCWCVIGALLTFFLVPESPFILLKNDKTEKATKVMTKIRGKNYDSEKEMAEIKATLSNKESAWQGIKQKVNLKAFGVLLTLHALQQLSGINAVLYHAHYIFSMTNTGIDENVSVIVVGVAQVLISIVAAVAVDRSGRILLFAISMGIMFLTIGAVGAFFTILGQNEKIASDIAVVPTIAIVLYICGFSLGTGPLPWSLFGEYLPNSVKTVMSPIIAFVNWMLAFAITWMMPIAMKEISPEYIFYAFALVCFLGIVFILLFVVETNQKTLEEIQADIASHTIRCPKFGKRERAA